MKALKPKTCRAKTCRRTFEPRNSMQKVCSPRCAHEVAREAVERKRRQAEKRAAMERRREQADARERLKTRPKLLEEAQEAVNRLVRELDRGWGFHCITCNGEKEISDPIRGGAFDAGHYLGTGANPGPIRFSALNIHLQCKACNTSGGHTRQQYREGLLARYGAEMVRWLDGPHDDDRLDRDGLRRIRDEARSTLKHHRMLRKEGKAVCPYQFRRELLEAEMAREA